MNTIRGLEDKLPIYYEREISFSPTQLYEFEEEFDDLYFTEKKLDRYTEEHEAEIEALEPFKAALQELQEKLSEIKLTYMSFIGDR